MPAPSSSQATKEFEFHISPACSSSRPQTGVGAAGISASSLPVVSGSAVSRRGLSTASARSGIVPFRRQRSS